MLREINIEELKKQASEGNIDSMIELARRYAMGIGMAIDHKLAFMYLERAAKLGDPLAMANLAIFYSNGVCGEIDVKRALHLFHSAACQGANIRDSVFQNVDKNDLYRLAAEGYAPAQYYYALTLGNSEENKRDSLILSASNQKLALAAGALAVKTYIANPTLDNIEAKKLFQQAVDYGYDYFQMLKQIAITEQQIGAENTLNICAAVRTFIGKKYYERPFILVKITSQKRAEELVRDGSVFFRSLGQFREISKPGVGDPYEGVANTKDAHSFWREIEEEAISEIFEIGMYDECMAHEKIFCLYALEYSEDGNFIYPDIRMRQFGDSAVVIWDGHAFIQRIEKELNKRYGDSIWFGHRRVNYNVIFSESRTYTEFSKTEPYAWQNEYRLVFDAANGRIESREWNRMTDLARLLYLNDGGTLNFFVDSGSELISIGDLSDISTMYPIDDFINLADKVTKGRTPYSFNNFSESLDHPAAYIYRPFIHLNGPAQSE